MVDKSQLKEDIARAEKHARELREALEKAEWEDKNARQAILRPLTQKVHDLTCTYNHTDGCGWGYEDGWGGWAHQRWLDKVESVLTDKEAVNPVTPEQLDKILDLLAEMKKIHPSAAYIIWKLLNR